MARFRDWLDLGRSTFTSLNTDDAAVKERVRKPLTEYLRTSISLIKQYAWSFPTFKAAPDGSKPDFEQLSAEGYLDGRVGAGRHLRRRPDVAHAPRRVVGPRERAEEREAA